MDILFTTHSTVDVDISADDETISLGRLPVLYSLLVLLARDMYNIDAYFHANLDVCQRKQRRFTASRAHIVRRVEYAIPEQNRSQRLGLLLRAPFRLAEAEMRVVVVVYTDASDGSRPVCTARTHS